MNFAGIDEDQLSQIEAILKTNESLRKQLAECRIKEASVSSPKIIIELVLQEIAAHYKLHFVSSGNILNNYYIVDKTGKWELLPHCYDRSIEDLWYGRRQSFRADVGGESCLVKLHKSLLNDGLPLVLIKKAGEYRKISLRKEETTHLLLFKFQPRVFGMRCDAQIAATWAQNVSHGYYVCHSNKDLEELSAIWLGRAPRTPSQSTLTIDGKELYSFLELIQKEPNARCFFLLSGQGILFAYIQVNDDQNNLLLLLPVGHVEA